MELFNRRKTNEKPRFIKEATIGEYTIGIHLVGSVEVLVDGKPFTGDVKGLLRDEIAPMVQMDVDSNWNTRQLAKKLIDNINGYEDILEKEREKGTQLHDIVTKRLKGLLETAKKRGIKELGWHYPLPDDNDEQAWDNFNDYGDDYGVWFQYWDDRVVPWKGIKFVLEGDKLICTLALNEYEELCDDISIEYCPDAQDIDSIINLIRMIEEDLKTRKKPIRI